MKLKDVLKVCSTHDYEVCVYKDSFYRFETVDPMKYMTHNVLDISPVNNKLYIFVNKEG